MSENRESRRSELHQLLSRYLLWSWVRRAVTAILTLLTVVLAVAALSLVKDLNRLKLKCSSVEEQVKDRLAAEEQLKRKQLGLEERLTQVMSLYNESTEKLKNESKLTEETKKQLMTQTKLFEAANENRQVLENSNNKLRDKVIQIQIELTDTKSKLTAREQELKDASDGSGNRVMLPRYDAPEHTSIVLFCHLRDGFPMTELARSSLLRFYVAHNHSNSSRLSPGRRLTFAQFNGSFRVDRQLLSPNPVLNIADLQDDDRFSAWFQPADAVASSADLDSTSAQMKEAVELLRAKEEKSGLSQLLLVVPATLRPLNPENWGAFDRINVFQITVEGQESADWSPVCGKAGVLQKFQVSQITGLSAEEYWRLESTLQVWAERVMSTLAPSDRKGA